MLLLNDPSKDILFLTAILFSNVVPCEAKRYFNAAHMTLIQVIEAQADMPVYGAVTLYSSLLTFTLHVHPDRLDYADQVLVLPMLLLVFF